MHWTHRVSDAASPVETGDNVPGAEDAADSQADTLVLKRTREGDLKEEEERGCCWWTGWGGLSEGDAAMEWITMNITGTLTGCKGTVAMEIKET